MGLTRGGWVPARLLCDRLGVTRLVSLRAQHWGVTATRDGAAKVTEGLSGAVRGETVLAVDDITDTGESLLLALEHVRAAGPARLESATLLHIDHAKFVPTYFAETIPRDAWVWVVFPGTTGRTSLASPPGPLRSLPASSRPGRSWPSDAASTCRAPISRRLQPGAPSPPARASSPSGAAGRAAGRSP